MHTYTLIMFKHTYKDKFAPIFIFIHTYTLPLYEYIII